MSNPRVGIIGAGLVGGTVAARMSDAGIDVTLMETNANLVDAIRQMGFRLTGAMTLQSKPIVAYSSTNAALDSHEKFDAVFVCVKAPFNKYVVGDVPTMLAEGGMAVSFQNGIDTERELLEAVGAGQTLRGVCNYAGGPVPNQLGAFNVVFNHPPNHMGAAVAGNSVAEAGARRVADLMSTAGLETEYAARIDGSVWRKAIMNAAMTPVAAILGMTMKEVMANEHTRATVESLVHEAIGIAEALGIDLGESYYGYAMGYLDKAGDHHPSMHYDFKNKVPSEIHVLNAAIAKHGAAVGVPAPYNTMISNLVSAIECGLVRA